MFPFGIMLLGVSPDHLDMVVIRHANSLVVLPHDLHYEPDEILGSRWREG